MTAPTPQAADRRQALLGMGFIVLSYFLFAFHDASMKWLVVSLSVWQMMVVRSATIVVGCLAVGRRTLVGEALRSPSKPTYLLLTLFLVTAWQSYYNAARELQLGELTTIYFSTPIIAIVLAQPLLGERTTLLAWFAAALGFAGVVVACDPRTLGISAASLLVLFASLLWALAQVVMRRLGRSERADRVMVQMLYTNGLTLVVAAAVAPFVWQPVAPDQWPLLIGLGALGGGAQFLMIQGFRRASPSVLAPFQYTALIWAFVLGYLIWGDVPRNAVFIGAAMIVVAGLIVLVSQRRR